MPDTTTKVIDLSTGKTLGKLTATSETHFTYQYETRGGPRFGLARADRSALVSA